MQWVHKVVRGVESVSVMNQEIYEQTRAHE